MLFKLDTPDRIKSIMRGQVETLLKRTRDEAREQLWAAENRNPLYERRMEPPVQEPSGR